jgi:hypothetical protein
MVAVIALIVLRWKSTKVSPEIQQMGDVSNLTHADRRNSFSGCDNDKIESLGPTMQKYNSESTLGKKIKLNFYNCIGSVMVSMLVSSAVDLGFESRSGQT